MNKQLRIRIILAALAVVTALAFTACADLIAKPVSISDRLGFFASELSKADRSGVYFNLDTAATSYSAAKASAFWDALFAKDGTYSVVITSSSDPKAVTASVTSATKLFDATVTFEMSSTGTLNPIYVIKGISYKIAGVQTTVFQ